MGWRDLFGGRATSTADLIAQSEQARPSTPPADQIAALVRDGEKIEAIKLYREEHGVGLADAKEAIDAMARGDAVPAPASAPSEPDADILDLVHAGELIQAIKVYRERYDVGLKEAKDAIDAMR